MTALQKIIKAFQSHDYSDLSLDDLYELVASRYLNPKTAARIATEI